jgi:Tfp pilus assembly PilM family ATPase
MPQERKLGIFWGQNSIYVAEILDVQIGQMFRIPILESNPSSLGAPSNFSIVPYIREAFQKMNLAPAPVQLSLPTKDIIFRSFLIPWMQTAEIKSAVIFEAPKYIPFPLDELAYSYHYSVVSEGAVKKIRVIFAAIKKIVLNEYQESLEQAGLTVESIEPSSSSLIRLLFMKKFILESETVALIEKGEISGKITIVDKGVPQFIRDFQLSAASAEKDSSAGKMALNRLLNEVRISLDFYNRQDPNTQIKQIKVVSASVSKELISSLEEELKVTVTAAQPKLFLEKDDANEMGFLSAVGAGLMEVVDVPSSFNFSNKILKRSKKSRSVSKVVKVAMIIPMLMVCGGIVAGAFFLTKMLIREPVQRLENVNVQLADMKDVAVERIEEKTTILRNKLSQIKFIRRESHVSEIISLIPQLLPQGMWLEDINVSYASDLTAPAGVLESGIKPDVTITGYAYSKITQEQFGMVSKYLSQLKEKESFQKQFQKIELDTVRSQQKDEFTVTFFKIRCL